MSNKLWRFYKRKMKYLTYYCPVFFFLHLLKTRLCFLGVKKGNTGQQCVSETSCCVAKWADDKTYAVNITEQSFLFETFLLLFGYLLSILLLLPCGKKILQKSPKIKVPCQMRVMTIILKLYNWTREFIQKNEGILWPWVYCVEEIKNFICTFNT